MTYKNAKTIMFGILIAMMILPFSMVDPAEAQKATPNISDRLDDLTNDYNRIEMERRSLVDELRAEPDSDKRDIIQKKIDAKLASMQKIMDEVDKLAPIEGDYNPTKKRSKRAITQGSTIYFSDNHKACSDWDLKTTSLGSGSIDVNVDTISWNWGVTNHKNVGFAAIFGCVDVYFEDISFTTRNNSKKQSCTSVTDNVTAGNEIQTCNCGIDNNNLLSWQIGTTYEPVSGTDTRGNDNWHGLHRVT